TVEKRHVGRPGVRGEGGQLSLGTDRRPGGGNRLRLGQRAQRRLASGLGVGLLPAFRGEGGRIIRQCILDRQAGIMLGRRDRGGGKKRHDPAAKAARAQASVDVPCGTHLYPIALNTASPSSAGLSATTMPADFIASIVDSASPLPPETMAPAWPMRRPG